MYFNVSLNGFIFKSGILLLRDCLVISEELNGKENTEYLEHKLKVG